jgi:preprotein translocase subunit SecE
MRVVDVVVNRVLGGDRRRAASRTRAGQSESRTNHEQDMAGITSENRLNRGSLIGEFFRADVYKRTQGRMARQFTFAALAAIIGIGTWRLAAQLPVWFGGLSTIGGDYGLLRFVLPAALLAIGLWVCWRIVNIPSFAEFLIAVEVEMAKVSWPSADEVFRSSVVIIFLIFALSAILAGYDLFWAFLLRPVLRG